MNDQAHILSFDEVRASTFGSPRPASGRPSELRSASSYPTGRQSSYDLRKQSFEERGLRTGGRTDRAVRLQAAERGADMRARSFAPASEAPRAQRAGRGARFADSSRGARDIRDAHPSRGLGAAQRRDGARRPSADESPAPSQEDVRASARQKGFFASVKDAVSDKRKQHMKEKAGKAFARQFESKGPDPSQAGPRAAVYKGEMGASHKRASRMQQASSSEAKGKRARFPLAGGFSLSGLLSSRRAVVGIVTAACVVFTCAFLYQPAQQYYHAIRKEARLEAELAAVESRNAALGNEVASLQSESGVEQRARDEFGWVKEGETAVVVQGLGETSSSSGTSSTTGSIVPGSIKAPETWYSPICDFIFGAE